MAEQKNIATYETSNLTNEQGAVINHDVSNILVSASAGTGKTFVMTERMRDVSITKKLIFATSWC